MRIAHVMTILNCFRILHTRYECLFVLFDGKIQNQYGGPGRDRTYEGEAKGFTVLPIWPLWNRPIMEPPIRLELMTAGLQNRCSTNWAKVACEADCIKMIVLSKYFCTIIGMISIIRISDGEKHFSEATNEYLKRLSHNVELYTLKPIKHTEIPYIKREETKNWSRKSINSNEGWFSVMNEVRI